MNGIALIILAAASAINGDSIVDYSVVEKSARLYALKSNLVPWSAGIANLEAETQIGRSFSLSLPIWWSPYFISNKYALRTLLIQPEFRYWIKNPGESHFFGIHAGVAWYNLKFKDYRYQDTSLPLLNAGVSYGYSYHIKNGFFAEFSIGAGYVFTKYHRFYNITNGAKIDTRQTTYFGLDKVEISLSYHFNL